MGYRSDLEAAQARASALEKKLASGQDENDALRQELEELKKPKKPKKEKAPKKAKVPRSAGRLRKLVNMTTIGICLCLLMGVGTAYWVYRAMQGYEEDLIAQNKQNRVLVERFIQAWADQRYEDAWALTQESYRNKVSKERFAREMKHHPSIPSISGATFGNPKDESLPIDSEGLLHTSKGDLPVSAAAYHGIFYGISTDGFDLLPPSDDQLISGHRFVAALIDKRFEDARALTHPIYRKGMEADAFAQPLAQNIWLTAATGFRLDIAREEGSPKNELRGLLLTDEGSVSLVLNIAEGGDVPWISEMIIGGKPSLPTP